MNWFERYGIVGAYFVISTFFWARVLSEPFILEPGEHTLIAAILAISFAPLGYIICVISQRIYYSPTSWWRSLFGGGTHVNREVVKTLIKDMNESEKKHLGIDNISDEAECEVGLSSYVRLFLKKDHLESRKYLATFSTRRWDVLSINSSIILATWLSPFAVLLLMSHSSRLNLKKEFKISLHTIPNEVLLVIAVIILLFLMIMVLISSNRILSSQTMRVAKDLAKFKNEAEVDTKMKHEKNSRDA